MSLADCLVSIYSRHMAQLALDQDLLDQARGALHRIATAEHDLAHARADLEHALRRLQLAGGSVRSIGKTIGLSHQRVQQLIDATEDGRGWKRRGRSSSELMCTFCGRNQATARKLIAGPSVYICDRCVATARRAIAGKQLATWTTPGAGTCSFCGKIATAERRVATNARAVAATSAKYRARGVTVCGECLDLCDEILAEDTSPRS
jgi:hypothetical protein